MHVDQSLEVIDFEGGPRALQTPAATEQPGRERLVSCAQFIFDRLTGESELAGDGMLHLLTAPYGGVKLACGAERLTMAIGQSVIVPAAMRTVQATVQKSCILLDMYVP